MKGCSGKGAEPGAVFLPESLAPPRPAPTTPHLTQVPRVLLPSPLQPLTKRVELFLMGLDRAPRVRHPSSQRGLDSNQARRTSTSLA